MGTGQTKILSNRQAKKNTLPHEFLPTAKSETILFSRSGMRKKKPALVHEFFSCCEIRNKDILGAGLIKTLRNRLRAPQIVCRAQIVCCVQIVCRTKT